jgi:glycosyltransferase involved in cell wall biosynthesis
MQSNTNSFPLVDIVIPTRNSEETIADCLSSLNSQTYPKDKYRVIIIDDSTDNTLVLVHSFKETLNIEVVNATLGPSDKRNLGVNLSLGEYIAFIDSDCLADPNWLLTAVECLKDESVGAVGGPNLTPLDDSLLAKCSGYIFSSFFGTGPLGQARYVCKGVTREVQKNDLILCNVVVRKDAYQKVGGFDPRLYPGEEINLFSKLSDIGYKLLYSPDVIVYHKRRPLFGSHLKQIFGYGTGRGQAVRHREDAFSYLLLIPIFFSLGVIASPFLLLINSLFRYLVYAGFLTYLILDILFSLHITLKEKKGIIFPLLLISFFLHHLLYGIGLLSGLVFGKKPAS